MSDFTRPITPTMTWPAGYRAALAVVVDLDGVGAPEGLVTGEAVETGGERLLSMLADLDLVASVVIDPIATGSGVTPIAADPAVWRLDGMVHATAADACERRLGRRPQGSVALDGELPEHAPEAVWLMDGRSAPLPTVRDGRVTIPYSRWWHDATWFTTSPPSPPSAMLEAWTLSLASVRTYGDLMTILLTGPISGHSGHLETVQRFLDDVIAAGDVWVTNGSGIAAHTLQETDR